MDFNKYDTVTAAEKGAGLHVKDPATMKPLYDNPEGATVPNGKPCIVILKGFESQTVRDKQRETRKLRASDPDEVEKPEDRSVDELHDSLVEQMVPRVVGFKNIHKGKKLATADDAKWFFELNRLNFHGDEKSFVQQAADYTSSRAGYLGNGSGD